MWTNGHAILLDEQSSNLVAPFQLSLLYDNDHICGASLISSKRALTAAHCESASASLDKYSVVAVSPKISPQSTRIHSFVAHPFFKQTKSKTFDIAVLFLDSDLQLAAPLRFIKLPHQFDPVPYGEVGLVATWSLESAPENECDGALEAIRTTEVSIHHTDDYDMSIQFWSTISAGRIEGGSGVCEPDEGNALVVDGIQIGILAWSQRSNQPNDTATYTRVSVFSDWIESVSNKKNHYLNN